MGKPTGVMLKAATDVWTQVSLEINATKRTTIRPNQQITKPFTLIILRTNLGDN